MSGSDTHADTIPLHRDVIAQAICDGKSKNLAYASLEILVAEVERERARADRAEAELEERSERLHRIHMFIDGLELRGIMNVALEDLDPVAALSAGSGEREAVDPNGSPFGMPRMEWEEAGGQETTP